MAFSIQDYLENNKIELGKITKEVGDTPYKGGHNDIRKTNYEVKIKEDGKLDLYTHKTVLSESTLNEASRIKFEELKPTEQKIVTNLQKHFNGQIYAIFDGIHGKIVELQIKNVSGAFTFDKDDFKFLLSMPIRWMENDGNIISIAF
jgi:hypothetical protein